MSRRIIDKPAQVQTYYHYHNEGRAPPHAVGQGPSFTTRRQVGGCAFAATWPNRSNPGPHTPLALRPVENRTTAQRARTRLLTWRLDVVVFADNAGHAPPHAIIRGSSSPTPRQVGGCGFNAKWPQRSSSLPRAPVRFARGVPDDRPRSTRALADLERGCLRDQRGARSTLRRCPRLSFTDAATDLH